MSVAQLGEVLEISQVRMMKTEFPDVFEGLGHLLHFSGGEEVERVPVPFVMEMLSFSRTDQSEVTR